MSGLRVIGGTARGRKLRSVPGDSTRPITDRAKESLFNIIQADLGDASILDMFAGTGAVGIEALSRGASYARFIDNHPQAIKTIRFNIAATGFQEISDIFQVNSFSHLKHQPDFQFEYIFIAPPQYKDMWIKALETIDSNPGWMSKDAWVIVQIDPLEYAEMEFQHIFEFEQRRYGNTLFIFYERVKTG